MKKLFAILFLFAEGTCFAQKSPALTVEQIMSDYKWMGISPYNVQWDQNSRYVYFNWNPKGAVRDPLYQVGVGNFEAREAADTTKRMVTKGPFVYSGNRSKVLFERNGDIILQDMKSGQEITLVGTLENETNPVFNIDESKVFFQQGDNLFSVSLSGSMFTQLTNLTRNKAGMEKGLSRQDAWLKEDQRALFDIIKKQDRDQKLDAEDRVLLSPKRPRPFYLEEKAVVSSLSISPNGRYVYFRITRQPESSRNIIVPNYVTGSGYTEDIPGRTKVGAAAAINDSYVRDTQTDSVYVINVRNLPGIKNLPEYLKEYPLLLEERTKKNEDRRVTIGNPAWNADGSKALLNIVSQDNKDRWIVSLDPLSGQLLLLDHQHDEAWIGGPGIATSAGITNLNWIDDHTVYFQSEATGYSHLYTVDVSSGVKKQLTAGNYEVLTLRLSNDKKNFYFTANIEHPGITHFYRLLVTGGTPVQLTSLKGGNEVLLSPDERWLAIRYSYTTKPWELYLQENKPGAKAIQITHSTTPAFNAYAWKDPEMITFKNRHGATVYAQVFQPQKPDPHKPAVVFVHSNGYLQNVHYMWSYHFREYMFNNLLVDNGYTVINIDYTASSGYGRDHRTGIYRHMGGKDLSDLTDGAKLLVEKYGVDPKNIGLYGGSYGGFLTLMALFTEPDVFKAGAALRSVTDWAHYNPRYTGNILNEPVTDEKAYKQSSPIYFASGLKGHLLMTHGIVDVNVNFQDIVRLSQRLIELGKNNWELAVYPLEDHNFIEPSSWTDQYKRIFKLFEETLKR